MKKIFENIIKLFFNGKKIIYPFYFDYTDSVNKSKVIEKVFKQQIVDLITSGIALSIILLFICFGLNIVSWSLLNLIFIPILLPYIWLLIEYIFKKGKTNEISLIKQAEWIGEEWKLPCEEKTRFYQSFGWFKFI